MSRGFLCSRSWEKYAACDWWSVGVILYEVFTGIQLTEVYPRGLSWDEPLQFPSTLSVNVRDFLSKVKFYFFQRISSSIWNLIHFRLLLLASKAESEWTNVWFRCERSSSVRICWLEFCWRNLLAVVTTTPSFYHFIGCVLCVIFCILLVYYLFTEIKKSDILNFTFFGNWMLVVTVLQSYRLCLFNAGID